MDKKEIFITAKWSNLLLFSYKVKPELLLQLTPPNVYLDKLGGEAVVSLVFFNFEDTSIKGVPIPLYGNFPEMDLRFYVKDKDDKYKGVVFIKEYIPRLFIAKGANLLYNEKYEIMKMNYTFEETQNSLTFNYTLEDEQGIKVITKPRSVVMPENSIKYFIANRNAGFGIIDGRAVIYEVKHSGWERYQLISYDMNIDFGKLFGKEWTWLKNETPFDVTIAKGSNVNIYDWCFLEF
jgi:uncharacterized protein YqjF (DUF2071 family)